MSKEEVYDSEITPLMDRIVKICEQHKIPMLANFNLDKFAASLWILRDDYSPSLEQLACKQILEDAYGMKDCSIYI
jgi:hypothetical protein